MLRTLFIIGALAVIVLIAKKMLSAQPRVEQKPSPRPLKDMVRCETCGLHLPVDESIKEGGHYFCSIEHRDRYEDAH
jgi:uncharacterized protein